MDIWLNNATPLRSHGAPVSGEPLPSPFPRMAKELYDRMLAAMRRKDWSHAPRYWHAVAPHVSACAFAPVNMAAIKEAQGPTVS